MGHLNISRVEGCHTRVPLTLAHKFEGCGFVLEREGKRGASVAGSPAMPDSACCPWWCVYLWGDLHVV